MSNIVTREEWTEWRVETDQTEDDFDNDEQGAREWLAICQSKPEWRPAALLCRTVVTETSDWVEAEQGGGDPA